MGEKKHYIIIAHTQFNVLLACAVAREFCDTHDVELFLVADANEPEKLVDAVRQWPASPFSAVHLSAGVFGITDFQEQGAVKRRSVAELREHIDRQPVDRVSVFNDYCPEDQFVVRHTLERYPAAHCSYIEDGAYVYTADYSPEFDPKYLPIYHEAYGDWWEPQRVVGSGAYFSEVWAIYPEYLRPELRGKQLRTINRQYLLDLKDAGWLQQYLAAVGVDLAQCRPADVLILLSHSDAEADVPDLSALIKALIGVLGERGCTVAVKYHPREYAHDVLSLAGQCAILPTAFPIEMLFLLQPECYRTVIGDRNSFLLMAKYLSFDIRAISLAPILHATRDCLLTTFEAVGVLLAEEIGVLLTLALGPASRDHAGDLVELLQRYAGEIRARLFILHAQIARTDTEHRICVDDQRHQVAFYRQECDRLEGELSASHEMQVNMRQEMALLQAGLDQEMTELRARIARQEEMLTDLHERNHALTQVVTERQNSITELSNTLTAMRETRIWRFGQKCNALLQLLVPINKVMYKH